MTPDALREAFLKFFETRGHRRLASDSLVPENDPTLLFTGAGMNQFKAEFMGKGTRGLSRATTSQKCLRMPDLDNVGRTASHHTFFEMLGNFSFGDYFKRDAVHWAWEFLAQIGLPPDRLSVTIYNDDEEAFGIWTREVGLPVCRVFRGGEDENFWPASAPSLGPNGICGPCSEIYFDFDPGQGPIPGPGPGSDGRRFVEIWNLVFTQFERQDGGVLKPLPSRNIDTGMGFERILRVVESVAAGRPLTSNFETALFAPIMDVIHAHVGRLTSHGTPEGTRTRRIADHVRAACFCIADGVRPSNEKQGYVVRKVLRRAMLDRHLLGGDLRRPWLAVVAGAVVETLGAAWPDLRAAAHLIASTISAEEEKFAAAFLSGTQRLTSLVERARASGQTTLAGDQAFLLYDTFGLPLDMQRPLLEEAGLTVDEDGFRAAMADQRRRSRERSRISEQIFDEGPLAAVAGSLPATTFVRDTLVLEDAQVLAVVDDDEGRTPRDEDGSAAGEGRKLIVVLDRTPFYAEGGGQVGDRGSLEGAGFAVEVDDVVSLRGISLHRGVLVRGRVQPGRVVARVDGRARAATARNHTATHLLHAALHDVLGGESTQAGSLVSPERLRFDFRFPRGLSADELAAVEDRVNGWVLANAAVVTGEMAMAAARSQGALALFGEKYGDVVRVVRVAAPPQGRDSVELCGGTHVGRSGDIGSFRIVSESSVAAGVRRIEARTGAGVLEVSRQESRWLARAAAQLKTSPDRLEERLSVLQSELKAARKELDELRKRQAGQGLIHLRRSWNGLSLLVAVVEHGVAKELRELAGSQLTAGCDLVLLALAAADGCDFVAAAGPRAIQAGHRADDLVRRLAEALGGRGGGKPGFAQGRGGAAADLATILERAIADSAGAPS